MRYLYAGVLGLLAQLAHGQTVADTLAPDAPLQVAPVVRQVSSQVDSAGMCTETLRWAGADGLVRVFYPLGQLKEYVPYADLATGYIHGLVTTWYASGQLCSRQPFLQGQRDGVLELYYENGYLKRRTQYVAGAELPGSCFDADGHALPYSPYEQLPLYPGGHTQLAKEVTNALRWPRDVPSVLALESRLVGVSFWVGKDGGIKNPQVAVSSQLPSLDRAVLAAIARLARNFTPARRDGVVVNCRYYLPIQFSRLVYTGRPN